MLRPHIVILGAGFGGMYVAKRLAPRVRRGEVDVTVVNRTNYFLFTPLLHEVATGGLSPQSVAEPLREIFAGTGVRIAQGTVQSIDPARQTVTIDGAQDDRTIAYDFLVIATGAETNYFGIPGADKLTYPLKDLSDAVRIRSRVIDVFERAILAPNREERQRLLSFAVVGGGATGVEVAAELSEFTAGMVKRYYHDTDCDPDEPGSCSPEETAISLVHMGKELLEMFPASLRTAAADRLTHNGVALHMQTTVASVTKDSLVISDGTTIPASTVIWAAGVKPIIPHFEGSQPQLAGNRLAVDGFFRLTGNERIFALGDAAGYMDIHPGDDPTKARALPQLAQVAEGQARIVSRNIMAAIRQKKQKPFHYHSKGSMVSVGEWFAIGEIYSLNLAGRLTWWLWRTVYLFKFLSWKKRVRIAFEWTFGLFYPRDITKLG